MKKKFLMLLALPMLLLTACGGGNEDAGNDPWGDDPWGEDDGDDGMFGKEKIKVYFYASASVTDPKLAFATQEVEVGGKLTKPATDPTNVDPAFTTFVGWSKHPIILSNDQLWNFDTDTVPEFVASGNYRLYGIWE